MHLSASVANVGDGAMLAQVSSAIRELGFEYAILRPTWFMENFSEAGHAGTIREKGIIVTATGEGKVPFVACEDIARVAFRALTDEIPQNTEHLILGPKLYSYDEVSLTGGVDTCLHFDLLGWNLNVRSAEPSLLDASSHTFTQREVLEGKLYKI